MLGLEIFILMLQSSSSLGIVGEAFTLLKDGGLLMGALLVIYGQYKLYRSFMDKLEEKHTTERVYLLEQLQAAQQTLKEKSDQDTEMIRDLTRDLGRRG